MNIQKFTAPSMKRAIDEVRAALGRDALIVRSQPCEGGVEVIAAVDYDETLLKGQGNPPASRLDSVDQAAARHSRVDPATPNRAEPLVDADRIPADRVSLGERGPISAEGPRPAAASRLPETFARTPTDRLDDVGAELRSLRMLVEQQLSGLAWRDLVRHQPHSAGVTLRLLQMGIAPALARDIADTISHAPHMEDAWRHALAVLQRRLPSATDDLLVSGGVAALLGPTGVGKTTTIAKLAGSFVQRHGPGSVGLITTDDFRLGAHEQLLAFGRVLGIPVLTARDAGSLTAALGDLSSRALVLIDTEGAGHGGATPRGRLVALDSLGDQLRRFLLLPANAQGASLERTVGAFSHRTLSGCIITKVDESGSLGEVISTTIAANLPAIYLSDGQQVPDDLHVARAEELVRRAKQLLMPSGIELEDDIVGLAFNNVLARSHV